MHCFNDGCREEYKPIAELRHHQRFCVRAMMVCTICHRLIRAYAYETHPCSPKAMNLDELRKGVQEMNLINYFKANLFTNNNNSTNSQTKNYKKRSLFDSMKNHLGKNKKQNNKTNYHQNKQLHFTAKKRYRDSVETTTSKAIKQ